VLSLEFLQKKELSLGGRPPWRLEGAGLASEDLKRAGALTPLGQKHTGWIWTGNLPLIKRNALTTEPQLLILDGKIWNIAVYEVELQKKNCNTENMLECVVAARQLWCWLQHWRYDLGTLMKCVCKVSIYHPPKNQHTIMILHNCSLPWILRRSPPQGSENMNTLWRLLAFNWSDSYVRMVLEKCMDQLQNTLSYLSITSVICWLHLSPGTCSLALVFSLIWLVPRNIFKHNPSYHHILASAHAPQSQPWQYPWSEIGSQQGWSCWQFQCIESICTKTQTFLFRKAREQLRYDGGIEPSCAWSWFFSIPCQPSCSAVWWGWNFSDFELKKQQKKCFLHFYNVCSE